MRRYPVLCLLLLASSCSKKADTGNDYAEVDGFCAEWAAQACNESVVDTCLGSLSSCKATQEKACVKRVPDGKYSSRTAEECLHAVGDIYTHASLTAADLDVVVRLGGACDKILSGSTGEGGNCAEDSDCNRDVELSCVRKAGVANGKCEKPKAVGAGQDCSESASVCDAGFYCDEGEHCVEGGKKNAACAVDRPCAKGFRCLGGTTGGEADAGVDGGGGAAPASATTCQQTKAKGEECKAEDECESRICIVASSSTGQRKCATDLPIVTGSALCDDLQ